MNLNGFYYDLPQKLIAQYPLKKRDQARLLVIDRKTKTIRHDRLANIADYLPLKSLLVLNNSKVIPARLFGYRKTGGRVEVFLLRKLNHNTYEALLRPLRKLHEHEKIYFKGSSLVSELVDKENRIVRFNKKEISRHLQRIGHTPLPPYIKREDRAVDRKYYQTVFAKINGSVASPTAGLHFTSRLLKEIRNTGHKMVYVTLHINYATFKPVEEKDIRKHHMHQEEYAVSKSAFARILKSRKEGKKVVAVGTTSCRVLETLVRNKKLNGVTDLFIYPGFDFKIVDVLITNFHQPLSTLLILAYAFGGKSLMKRAYQEAMRKNYRFFSYGDGMIIL